MFDPCFAFERLESQIPNANGRVGILGRGQRARIDLVIVCLGLRQLSRSDALRALEKLASQPFATPRNPVNFHPPIADRPQFNETKRTCFVPLHVVHKIIMATTPYLYPRLGFRRTRQSTECILCPDDCAAGDRISAAPS